MSVKPIPDGHHTLTPYLIIRGAAEAIEFYKKAFGAEEQFRSPMPDGKIMHARLKIGDSMLMVSEEMPHPNACAASPHTLKGTAVLIHLFVPDVDALVDRAVKAGATVKMPVADMFWGDRYGQLADPFGHVWSVATHKEDLTPDQMQERAKKMFANFGKK